MNNKIANRIALLQARRGEIRMTLYNSGDGWWRTCNCTNRVEDIIWTRVWRRFTVWYNGERHTRARSRAHTHVPTEAPV